MRAPKRLLRRAAWQRPAAVSELARPEYHRVNTCAHFRKEVSETMALIEALGAAMAAAATPVPDSEPEALLPWAAVERASHEWHVRIAVLESVLRHASEDKNAAGRFRTSGEMSSQELVWTLQGTKRWCRSTSPEKF